MTEIIDTILTLSGGQHVCLQSLYNDTDAEDQPVSGGSYYVAYRCAGPDDKTPAAGHQPGQVYRTDGIATIDNAAEGIQV